MYLVICVDILYNSYILVDVYKVPKGEHYWRNRGSGRIIRNKRNKSIDIVKNIDILIFKIDL
jgi:hypothetical protein